MKKREQVRIRESFCSFVNRCREARAVCTKRIFNKEKENEKNPLESELTSYSELDSSTPSSGDVAWILMTEIPHLGVTAWL